MKENVKLNLEQIRTMRGFTQVDLAGILRMNQSGLSKLERRSDMYLSMLRSLIQAMGGRLELRAVFPDEIVEITELDGEGIISDLRELLHQRCQIQPNPDLEYNDFRVESIDESAITFQKLSNQQYLDVPTRRVAEILPATGSQLPVVILQGSLNWSAQKKLWQFRAG
jgi:transcriptional regulator with XRE-family HTH domain